MDGISKPLVQSKALRFATVFIFYICQGIPLGLFYFAVPAYMAEGNASAAEIATVISFTALPWSLKLVNGFLMDRYTFLPMGRRRIWIIGAQSVMIGGMIAGALLSPGPRDYLLLATLAFIISAATTFQDVAIDSLVVDIMPENEQSKIGGIMFGAQIFGMSAATFVAGRLIESSGITAAYITGAAFLALALAYATAIREREGERRFPWSVGSPHPRNVALQVEAWVPLLRKSFRAFFALTSVVFLPFLLVRATSFGAYETLLPIITSTQTGWSSSDYTDATSAAQFLAAGLGLVFGGWVVSKLGFRVAISLGYALTALTYVIFGLNEAAWNDSAVILAFLRIAEICAIFLSIAMIPAAMQLCSPMVAATQFTLYMAVANFGRPLGSWIGATTTQIDPSIPFLVVGGIAAIAAVAILLIPMAKSREPEEVAEHPPTGELLAAVED